MCCKVKHSQFLTAEAALDILHHQILQAMPLKTGTACTDCVFSKAGKGAKVCEWIFVSAYRTF